ncbi:MAG TPA: NYN domain-containing protein [Rhizomicrobium sp.]|jgi:hypothetical protein|nr:NYN domain-containing protein [Rhizomicrobium sp.]
MAPSPRVAVLIDGENLSAAFAPSLFEEVGKLGDASIRRVYGERRNLQGWDRIQAQYRIKSRRNGPPILRKNPTDFTLIVDAITLLHRKECDVFCIVSSDGDFSPLAHYIRQSKKPIYGFGESKAPKSMREACSKFIELNLPAPARRPAPASPSLKRKAGSTA